MYRHILVPIDDSLLSIETVQKAVALAKALDAKVTFFHAQTNYGASSVGALERVMAPTTFNEGVAGEARALLAKAEVVARTAGVVHDALAGTSDRPYEAIVDTAEARRCDLIFMASHGRRGIRALVLGSQTQSVLHRTSIPVLVSTVESNVVSAACDAPLAIIRDEHRSMAAVVHGLEYLVREARASGKAPSFPLLHAIVHYIRAFPEKLHHPKEDTYLFPRLRARTREYDATLDALEAQHVEGAKLVDALAQSVMRYESDPAGGFPAFADAATRFATTQMEHMGLESKVIIPAARKHLTDEDWALIATAFADHGDPRFTVDADEEYRQLFARILNLAPGGVVGAVSRPPSGGGF
ncbi:MAG: universal stress protein [Burkholderiales bacterium]|nr:universal stress protein [Burkholderiales bacterium]